MKSDLIEQIIKISKEAGKAILEVYNTNFDYQLKEDLSPLTKADTFSHNIIYKRLKILTPDIPILSEENSDIPFKIRSSWKQYWLVDPLDGTKEFVKKNGEFTVNIALIENNTPIFGIIHVPVTNETYWGSSTKGSFYIKGNNQKTKLCVEKKIRSQVRIVASRSHPSKMLDTLLEEIGEYKIITKGSSLKFCMIASGQADLYIRIGLTSEWDTAAGDAIVKFAGGKILTSDRKLILYNTKKSYLNPDFIVSNNMTLIEKILIKIERKEIN